MKRKITSSSSGGHLNDSRGISFDTTVMDGIIITDDLAGKIESLQMVNFMCHSNLELTFNRRVNFITGRNGSGKSAIMAALVVVLGGSASLTNRGTGITDFIKKGENWARVTVTLINEGVNSFKKKTYGNRVIISRNISSSGYHSYLCQSAHGNVVSKKRDEVDKIVLAFNLQIKNPICILNQDVARNFLCASDSSLRFNMFARATQLEQLRAIYEKTMELLTATRNQLAVKQKGIRQAKSEIKELKNKLKVFASLEKRIEERTSLENEYVWSLVTSEEKKLNELLDSKNDLIEEKVECTRGEESFDNVIKELEEQFKKWQRRLEKKKRARDERTEARLEAQKRALQYDKEVNNMEAELNVLLGRMERVSTDIQGVQEHLQQSELTASQSHAEKKQVREEIRALKGRLSDLREEIANAQRDIKKAEEARYNSLKSLDRLKSDLVVAEQNKKRLDIMLPEAKAKGQITSSAFGPYTRELLRAIEEAARQNCFYQKPVGPCGMYVELKGDPKWARAVESVIGGLMSTYRCDNQKDFQVLSKIMDRVCGRRRPSVIIGKFLRYRHDVRPRKVSVRGFQSVLDVLAFSNDVVFNTFIDQARIETVLLFETDQQAASIQTNVQNVPKNLRMGVTLRSDQYFPAPNYRTYSGNPHRPLRYFGAVGKNADTVKRLEAELKDVNREILEKRSEMEGAKETMAQSFAALNLWKDKLKSLKLEEGSLQTELNHLRDFEETRPVVITRVALKEELENLQKKHKKFSEEATQLRMAMELLKKKRDGFVIHLNSIVMEEDELHTTVREWEEFVEEKKKEYRKVLQKRGGNSDRLAEINKQLGEMKEELTQRKSAVEEKIREAMEVCPDRVDTDRSPIQVQKLLEKCEKYLKTTEKMAGSREATITEYKTKKELFQEMRKKKEVLEKATETLTMAADKREQNLNILESYTATLVSLYFQATLQTRGYDGQVKIDFRKKALELEVKTKEGAIARKDSKTLSGGERSYSMVSFILAIWKVVNLPVYFMDEFDVFMDKVNRKVIMDLLLEHADRQCNKQFFFITPQDISSVKQSDVISVYRLPDPIRTNN